MAASTNPQHSIAFAVMGALCGFALIVLPNLSDGLSVDLQPYRWPMTVVGLAAIAAALGSQAVAKNKLFSAGGMAAIVVIFGSIFTPPKASFVFGDISGTDKFPSAAMMGTSAFLIGKPNDRDYFHFFARESDFTAPNFYLIISNIDGAEPRQIIIGCISTDILKKNLNNAGGLHLSVEKDGGTPDSPRWKLMETQKSPAEAQKAKALGQYGNSGCQPESMPPLKAASLPARLGNALLPSAYAMPAQAPPTPPLALPGDVDAIFRELGQGDFASQVRTQDRVARLRDVPSISAIVKAWKAPWKAQVDTGLMVAWVHGIRLDRAVAVPIAAAMSKEQLDHIVELAGSHDYTVRYNATELLSWMLQSTGWQSPPPATQADIILTAVLHPFTDTQAYFQAGEGGPSSTMHDFSAYNAMIALNDAKCSLRPPDRTRVSSALQAFTASPQIKALKLEKTSAAAGQFQGKQC